MPPRGPGKKQDGRKPRRGIRIPGLGRKKPGRDGGIRAGPGMLDAGLEKFYDGDVQGALDHFGAMIRDDPGGPDGYYGMGAVLASTPAAGEALEHLEKAASLGHDRAETRLQTGNAYQMIGMEDEAMGCYREVLAERPDLMTVHIGMTNIYNNWGMYGEAAESADRALRIDPRFHVAKALKGTALMGMGRRDDALALLREAARDVPGSHPAQRALGNALAETGDPEGALRCFDAVIRIDPLDSEAHHRRGLMLSKLGDHAGAYAAHAASAELAPDAQVYTHMAMSLADMHEGEDCAGAGWHAEALDLADRAIGENPSHAQAHSAKARLLEMAGGDPAAHRDAAARLDAMRGGDPSGAADGAPPGASDPRQIRLAWGLRMLMEEGNLPGALSHFRAMVRDEPGFAEGHAALGTALGMSGAAEEALAEFKEALRLGADGADVHSNMGNVYDMMGMQEEAEECYRKSVPPDAAHGVGRSNLAASYSRLGRSEDAVRAADDALRLLPGNPGANVVKGTALADLGRFQESVRPLEEAVRASPGSYEACMRLGESLSATNDTPGALRCFDAAIQIDPDDAWGHLERGNMLARLRRLQEAYDSYSRSAEIEPRAQAYANMAMTLLAMHTERRPGAQDGPVSRRMWYAKAVGLADRAIKMDPGYAFAHFVKMKLLAASGREAEAEKHLSRAIELDPDFAWDADASHLSSTNAERRRRLSSAAGRAGPPRRPGGGRAGRS